MTKNNPMNLIFKGIGAAIGYGITTIGIPLVIIYVIEFYGSGLLPSELASLGLLFSE